MNAFQRELSSLQHRQQLLYILLFSFATVIVWIGISLLTSQQQTGIPAEIQLLATPLNPTIGMDVLDSIRQKKSYSDEELATFPIYKIVSSRDGGTNQRVDISEPAPSNSLPLGTPLAPNVAPTIETATPAATLDLPVSETPVASAATDVAQPSNL